MGERDMDEDPVSRIVIVDQSSPSRERKMRMLKRLAEALNRPVGDFFDTDAEPATRAEMANEAEPGHDC